MIQYSYDANLGGVALDDIVELSANYGRRTAQYQPARGDGAEIFDLGATPRKYVIQATLTGTFADVADKRSDLISFTDDGDERTFTHPLDGPVQVRVSSAESTDGWESSRVTLTLEETKPFSATRVEAVDSSTFADVEAMAGTLVIALQDTTVLLSLAPEDIPDPNDGVETASAWDADTTQATMEVDLEAIVSEYATMDNALALRTDVDAYRSQNASLEFQGELRRYARTVAAQAPQYGSVTLRQAAPLIVFLTERIGAERANDVYPDVIARNSIRDPRIVQSGVILEIPQ